MGAFGGRLGRGLEDAAGGGVGSFEGGGLGVAAAFSGGFEDGVFDVGEVEGGGGFGGGLELFEDS